MCTPERQPCPDRILDDIGGAFGMGAVGGTAFHFLKGVYNSPKSERFIGGTQAVRMNAPRLGGSFAVWGGLFSTFDCTMVYVRQKEDPGACGIDLRILGVLVLGLIEGAGIMLNKFTTVQQQSMIMLEDDAQANQAGFQNSASEFHKARQAVNSTESLLCVWRHVPKKILALYDPTRRHVAHSPSTSSEVRNLAKSCAFRLSR
ncbi:hypothetical protein Tco_0617693 [Tanacetum coccineum]